MTSRRWIVGLVIAFCFFFGSFFFFAGAIASLAGSHREKGNIAVVEVLGGIFESKPVVRKLRDLKKEEGVKAVVLRVDSPGGSVSASQEIFEAVKDFKEKKPIIVSMGTVAASGGYYVAAPASRIVANPGTVTGSIGVRMELMNVEDLLQWVRLRPTTLKSGVLKDIGSPTRPMTPEEREFLEGILRELHAQFKKAIAESRGLNADEVEALSDGRVFTGETAKEKKLIDEIGSLDRAVTIAGELAGLKEEPEPFYPPDEDAPFLQQLIEGATGRFFDRLTEVLIWPARFSYRASIP